MRGQTDDQTSGATATPRLRGSNSETGDAAAPGTDASRAERLLEWLRREIESGAPGAALGEGYQAATRVYRTPMGEVVVKRPHGSGLLRHLGQRAIRREGRVYERLEGIAGVPRCYGLIDDKYLVMEHVVGRPFRGYETRLRDRERFFGALLRTLEAMHRAGVAHGDLKRKDNLLVGPEERPYVVDFGVACLAQRGRWNAAVFRWFSQADYNAWIKLKYRRSRTGLSPADAALYRPLLLERLARWIRIPYQKITLRRWRKRRRTNG